MDPNKLDVGTRKRLTNFLMRFCKKNIGHNPYKKDKVTYRVSNSTTTDFYGICMGGHKIVVFIKSHDTVKEFIKTFIHEYVHTTQPIKSQYRRLYKKYGYDNHPYEIEAVFYECYFYRRALMGFNKTL